jgi:mannose-6-phosphate isomerase-like protein (cupin superfamily)
MKAMISLAFGLLSTAATAQAPLPAAAPIATNTEQVMYVTAAQVNELLGKAPGAAKAGVRPPPLLQEGPFKMNMEYHDAPATTVVIHENDAELFIVLDGSGTITLGGTLVNPTRNGANLLAATATGGTTYKLAKGDMVLVPENTAHAVTQVDGKAVVLLSMHLPHRAP